VSDPDREPGNWAFEAFGCAVIGFGGNSFRPALRGLIRTPGRCRVSAAVQMGQQGLGRVSLLA
jgi:hypothetical protein